LKLRIMEAFNYISEIRICAICSAPMALRKAKTTKNEFYGCTRFPECNNTERT